MISSLHRILLVAAIASAMGAVHAEQDRNVPLVGQVMFTDYATFKPYDEGFRAALRALGWVDGKNVTIVARFANGDDAQIRPLVRELVALPVDVLLVSPSAVRAAMEATTSLPIVCANMFDAVESGLVASLSHPGGNLTGLTYQGVETDAKRLELARELVPALKRLAVLFDGTFPHLRKTIDRTHSLANGVGIAVHVFGVLDLEETQRALTAIDRIRPQALFLYASPRFTMHRHMIMGYAGNRYPVIADSAELARAGAVVGWSEDDFDMFRRSATYVDKILRGARPGDLPIEQPAKFDFVINLKSAKALGMTIPESIMVRATEIIR